MVGVAGRSGGCHTCLKRRVKCDKGKPTCQRCDKAGYTCKGYERRLDVRFHSFASLEGVTKSKRTSATANFDVGSHGRTSSAPLPPAVSLVAFRDNIQYAFLFSNLVWCHYGSPWLQESAKGRLGVVALEACQAFSLKVFGQHHHLTDIEIDGAQHYGNAVRKLSSRLTTAGNLGPEHLLIPIMILLLHSSTANNAQASAVHLQGLIQLLQICGPEPFAEEPLRGAFESCRAIMITMALTTKSRTFLEDEAWAMGPWSFSGYSGMTAHNQLIDILAHVPGFLHDQEEYNETGHDPLRQILMHKVMQQLSATRSWRCKWQKSNQDAAYQLDHEPDYPLLGLRQSYPFPKFIVCSSWRQAIEICLYNAVVLSLLGILWSLEDPPIPVLADKLSCLEQMVVKISHTFEAQLTTEGQRYGLCLTDMPLLTPTEISSARESTQPNFISRGIWLKLWPSFPFI